jgi:drug/metabolite transporter (DMT)-like permease
MVRCLIVVLHLLLIYLAWSLSERLFESGTYFSPLWLVFFSSIFLLVAIFYPHRKSNRVVSYARRKIFDFLACFCGFAMAGLFLLQLDQQQTIYPSASGTELPAATVYKNPAAEKILKAFSTGEKKSLTGKEKRIVKNEFKFQLKEYAKAKIRGNKQQSDQVLSIILLCIAASGILYLLTVLSCTLSCNGSAGAAIAVLVVGLAGLIIGVIFAIRAIEKHSRKEREKQVREKPSA